MFESDIGSSGTSGTKLSGNSYRRNQRERLYLCVLSSMLQAAGYRVGMFTSPHLIKINERMQIDEKTITDDEWTEVFEEVMHAVEEAKKDGIAHPSFFEFVFLMAAVYFQKQQVDYAIFETGMGGRLDATNIVQPILTIITSVGMDHMQYLGDTLEKIAFEKAGIMKKDVPALFFDRKDTATQVIVQQAKVVGAPLRLVEKSQYKISKISEKPLIFHWIVVIIDIASCRFARQHYIR